jgi:electron transfer flavoprotein beta subunit
MPALSQTYHIVLCGGLVPDPLQTLEPVMLAGKPGLKNELMLPQVLDPFVNHGLNEAAKLMENTTNSKLWLVMISPKAKIQQAMMALAQKTSFTLVAVDGPLSGFSDSHEAAAALFEAISGITDLDRGKLLLFGGWSSANRASGTTLQLLGEKLGIHEQFHGVDKLTPSADGSFTILERVEAGQHLESSCTGTPVAIGWATGDLADLPNNPKVGMMNMPKIMPAIGKAKAAPLASADLSYLEATLPAEKRQTRVVNDMTAAAIAAELKEWIKK